LPELVSGQDGILFLPVFLFGWVPFFFYILHIPLIRQPAGIISYIRKGEVSPRLFTDHPTDNQPPPEGYTRELGTFYMRPSRIEQ